MELAPPDEKHFDGSGTALLVASAVAGAVGSGVLAAIRQAAQNGSTALIKKAAAEIRKRLSGENVQQIFAAEGTRDSDDAAMDAAASVFAAARQASASSKQRSRPSSRRAAPLPPVRHCTGSVSGRKWPAGSGRR
jgi:hypothetical protein